MYVYLLHIHTYSPTCTLKYNTNNSLHLHILSCLYIFPLLFKKYDFSIIIHITKKKKKTKVKQPT